LANFANQPTPRHDFSKKLEMESSVNGKVLLPASSNTKACSWTAVDNGAFSAELDNAVQQGTRRHNNTLAIKFSAPSDSKRFSFNICPLDHNNFSDVLLHFNPRQFEAGGRLVLNSQDQGTWGQAMNVPASTLPLIFGQPSCTLIVQIQSSGFDIFLDSKHIAHLTHRRPPFNKNDAAAVGTPSSSSSSASLVLNFPATDDYNHPEKWTVHKVWWGYKPPMTTTNINITSSSSSSSTSSSTSSTTAAPPPGAVKTLNLHHPPRKLFLRGLAKLASDREIEYRKAELERAFRKYGGPRGVKVIIAPKYKSFAFVEMEEASQTDVALREMKSRYCISRARFSRHEALQERQQQQQQQQQQKG
jgi:hypothetical protein